MQVSGHRFQTGSVRNWTPISVHEMNTVQLIYLKPTSCACLTTTHDYGVTCYVVLSVSCYLFSRPLCVSCVCSIRRSRLAQWCNLLGCRANGILIRKYLIVGRMLCAFISPGEIFRTHLVSVLGKHNRSMNPIAYLIPFSCDCHTYHRLAIGVLELFMYWQISFIA